MRVQVTRKQISDNYFCVSVGYCDLQFLLHYESSPYYTAGTYGWNFDIYPFEFRHCNVAICSGYRGMPGKSVLWKVTKQYEIMAEKICADNDGHKKERLREVIELFLAEVFGDMVK
jgi:hypothetical protein